MTWNPVDPQPAGPHLAVKTARKAGALVRWVLVVVIAGLVIAAVIGIGIGLLFTAIESGL
ncbi:MAG: hypothetical protein ACKOVH_08460 [Actinomycetota bacterium]